MTYEDAAASSALPCPADLLRPAMLPTPLIYACEAAMDRRYCQDLHRTARQALVGILTHFNLKTPDEPVFASRDRLLERSRLGSQPTLRRGLQELEAQGYITREQTKTWGRAAFGRFARSHIWLTTKARIMLGLAPSPASADSTPKDEQPKSSQGTYSQGPAITVSDGKQRELTPPSLQPMGQLQARQRNVKEGRAGGSSERDTRYGIANELVPLIQLGVLRNQVFMLMKVARDHGHPQQLGAVVRVLWTHLVKVAEEGGSVVGYLITMLKKARDYANLDRIRLQPEQGRFTAAAREHLEAKLPTLLDRGNGLQVFNRQGQLVGVMERTGAASGWIRNERGVDPVNLHTVHAWVEGDLILRGAGQGSEWD